MNVHFLRTLANPSDKNLHAFRAKSWHMDGLFSLRVDDPRLTDEEREMLHRIGHRLYGANGDDGRPQ